MSMRSTELRLMVGGLLALASSGITHAQQAPVTRGTLEEVVVTAQKRVQRAQDVPTSMSVLSADKLEAQGMMQLADYAKQVPGLKVIGAGGPGQGRPVLRGLSTGTDRNALVGLYLDDVPFAPSSVRSLLPNYVFDPTLADVDRIEVLKGPQSTLYGAHALTGLIKFITKRPDLNQFDASLRLDGSQVDDGESGYSTRVSANVPIMDSHVGVRVSGFYRKDPGYVDDLFHGIDDANGSTVKGGHLSLLARFSDNLETTFSGLTQDIDIDGSYNVYVDRATLKPSLGGLANNSRIPQPTSLKYNSLSNTTTFTMPFATLTNIASYAEFSVMSVSDISGFLPTAPAVMAIVDPAKSRRFSDELRLASHPGTLEWMLGAFYTDETAKNRTSYRGTDLQAVILPPSSPFFNIYTFVSDASFEEQAIFGNLTYHLTSQFEVSLGARYNTNDQNYRISTAGIFSFPNPNFMGFPTEDSANNYLATASYKPSDNLTLYVRAANAYRPGGANVLNAQQLAGGAPRTYSADTLWNYETGIKGSALDGALTYSVAIYHVDWDDTQINVPFGGFSVVGNIGKAKSNGAEISLSFVPLDGLSIALGGAYSEAEIDTNAPLLFARKGEDLPYSPEVSLSAGVDYRMETTSGIAPRAGLSYAYYGAQNTTFRTNPSFFRLPSYGILDARAGIDWGQYSLVARVDNVTNKYAPTSVSQLFEPGLPVAATIVRPRTFGLSLEARF